MTSATSGRRITMAAASVAKKASESYKRHASSTADEVEEDDCGFKFRRQCKKSKNSEIGNIPVKKSTEIATSETIINTDAAKTNSSTNRLPSDSPSHPPQQQQQEQPQTQPPQPRLSLSLQQQKRRRRSSFAAIASRASGRPSATCSFSVSLSSKLPPSNVSINEYYKHLMPDLPGPIKMRQLMVWAVQRAAARQRDSPALQELASATQNAILNNQINTSWYQRPVAVNDPQGSTGSKNQEIQDCIQLYERYSQKLRLELSQWQELEGSLTSQSVVPQVTGAVALTAHPASLDDHVKNRALLKQAANWFTSLPETAEEMHWTLSVAANFETHARSYCEGVFQQISARLFGGHVRPAPIALLRALSNTAVGASN